MEDIQDSKGSKRGQADKFYKKRLKEEQKNTEEEDHQKQAELKQAETESSSITSEGPAIENEPQDVGRYTIITTRLLLFDLNPEFLTEVRGLMSMTELLLSLAIVIYFSLFCKTKPSGFNCSKSETFLFTVAATSLITGLVHIGSCVLSKSTDIHIVQTIFEVGFCFLFSITFLASSLLVFIHEKLLEEDWLDFDFYESPKIIAIAGLINGVMYANSVLWHYIYYWQR